VTLIATNLHRFEFDIVVRSLHSCSARAKRTLFSAKSTRTLAHFIM